jgi:ATP-dependent helicase/nuclease subunit A
LPLEADGATGHGGALAWRDSLTEPRHEAEETQRMRECGQAARWVAGQISAGVPPKEVLVLARKRDRLSAMQDALRALHLPCVQPEKADLFDAPEVQDMVALLDVLVSTGHDLSLARALKSPLFGLGDDALVALALLRRQPDNAGTSWFDLLQRGDPADATPVAEARAALAQYKDWVDTLPPHDALHAIYAHGDVLARFAAAAPPTQRAAVQANLRALLAAALQHDGGRYLAPYAFVRAMKKGGVRAPGRVDAQAIRLLTVHGAKGLEAQCVLLLDTDTRPQKAETMGVLVDWPGEQAVPAGFVFLASESSPPPSAVEALAVEQQARQREELNMLYVAMTRAKHCLALSSVQPASSAPGSWWNRLETLVADVAVQEGGEALAEADGDAASHFAVAELPALPAGLGQGRQGEAGAGLASGFAGGGARDGARRAAAVPSESTPESRLGDAMHQLLEQAGVAGLALAGLRAQGWPPARLARLAQDHDITAPAAARAAQLAQRILAGEGAWAWEPAEVDSAVNEAPLNHQGQSLRLDRLVHRPAKDHGAGPAPGWWVLDYKSAAQPERQPGLLAQLQRYRDAVRALMPGEPVHAAFLTGDGRMVPLPSDPGLAGGAGAMGHTLAPAAPPPQAASPAPSSPGKPGRPSPDADSPQGSLF